MAKARQIVFVVLVLLANSVDTIVRHYFPEDTHALNVLLALLVALGVLQLHHLFKGQAPQGQGSLGPVPEGARIVSRPGHPLGDLFRQTDTLLALRFFAAFLVFVTHMGLNFQPATRLLHGFWRVLYGGAHTGMCIFFTLSGYLMGKAFVRGRYTFDRRGILDFYQSRWVRIYPLMVFVILVLGAAVYPRLLRFDGWTLLRLLTLTFNGSVPYRGIDVMWSLSVEFQYYLMAPFLFALFHGVLSRNPRRGFLVMGGLVCALLAAKFVLDGLIFSSTPSFDPNYHSLAGNLPFFLTGFLVNYVTVRVPARILSALNTNAAVLLLLATAYLGICNLENLAAYTVEGTHLYYCFITAVTGVFILLLEQLGALRRRAEPGLDVLRVLQGLGVLSYGFYLWHRGLGAEYAGLFPEGLATHGAYLSELGYCAAIILALSLTSYLLVEERFNRFKAVHRRSGADG